MDQDIGQISEPLTRQLANAGITSLFGRVDRLENEVRELDTPLSRFIKGWLTTLFSVAVVCTLGLTAFGGFYLYYVSSDVGNLKAKVDHLEDMRKSYEEFKKVTNQRLDDMDGRLQKFSKRPEKLPTPATHPSAPSSTLPPVPPNRTPPKGEKSPQSY